MSSSVIEFTIQQYSCSKLASISSSYSEIIKILSKMFEKINVLETPDKVTTHKLITIRKFLFY